MAVERLVARLDPAQRRRLKALDVPDPETLSKQLAETYDLGNLYQPGPGAACALTTR